jgi:outer membrane protein TolC
VLIARENLQILDSTYQNMLKVNADMKAFAKQGLIDQTDADQMELTVTSLKTTLDYVTRMADVAEKYLKIQLGLDINAKMELAENLNQLMNTIAIENLIVADFVLENNVDYQMLATSEKSAELLLKLNKTNYLPTVAGFYQYYKEFNDNAFSFTPPHVLGVNVSIPIFTSGSNAAKVSQAKIDLLKAQETKNQLSNALKLDFYNSKSQLMAAKDKYDANTKNMALAKKIYNNSLEKYKLGMISSTDLTQVQNQYLQVQTNYYTSLQELIAASDKLEKLLTPNTQQ